MCKPNLDDYDRTPEERKKWLEDSQKYWAANLNQTHYKIVVLQKSLFYLEKEFQNAEITLRKIEIELGE